MGPELTGSYCSSRPVGFTRIDYGFVSHRFSARAASLPCREQRTWLLSLLQSSGHSGMTRRSNGFEAGAASARFLSPRKASRANAAGSSGDVTHGGVWVLDRANLPLQIGSRNVFPDDPPPTSRILSHDWRISWTESADGSEEFRATGALSHDIQCDSGGPLCVGGNHQDEFNIDRFVISHGRTKHPLTDQGHELVN